MHTSKHKVRKLCLEAAKNAVKQVLKEQDALVEKAAKKWATIAIQKYPPAIVVSSHPDKPNHFTAPPMIHLSLGGPSPVEKAKKVKKAKKAVKKAIKAKKVTKKVKKMAKKVTKKVKTAPKKVSKKKVAKAAAKAKKAAGKVVPEKKH